MTEETWIATYSLMPIRVYSNFIPCLPTPAAQNTIYAITRSQIAMTTTDIDSVLQPYPEHIRIFSGSPMNTLRRKPTYSSKHLNGPPEYQLSTTDRATPILAPKALGTGSSPNISSGDTWNASGTIPEPFRQTHQNWIPEPFRNHSGKFTKNFIPDTLRYTPGYPD